MFLQCLFTVRLQGAGQIFDLEVDFTVSSLSVVFFRPSDSGKSLAFLTLAGLIKPRMGHISVNGRALFDAKSGFHIPARKRRIGFVFQDHKLFPHLSAYDNVAFGLKRPFGRCARPKVRKWKNGWSCFASQGYPD